MAEKRMFSRSFMDSDAFLDMPVTAQLLYIQMAMRADDDGMVSNPNTIKRLIGASDSDLKLLIEKDYIIPFDSGIVAIKHWHLHNTIRNDRYKPTIYQEEYSMLKTGEMKEYFVGIPSGNQLATQSSIDKISIDKISIGESSKEELSDKTPVKNFYGKYKNVLLTDDELNDLKNRFSNWQTKVDNFSKKLYTKGYTFDDHYLTIIEWAENDAKLPKVKDRPPKSAFNNYEDTNEIDYKELNEILLDRMLM